nr:tRNA (adenosine(37)-N6)-threonylcarbamoyltransferase complex dimerization subunit type 1 TsaB [Haloferula luteola]
MLTIESSTNRASLALFRDSECVFEDAFESDRNHNALLFAPLEKALALLAGESLTEVVIGTGPGSYSGTRVGIAAGQGVALVHACPAIGLSSLLATSVTEGVAIGDARRGSAWWAAIGTALPEPELIDPHELAERLQSAENVFSFENVTRLGLPKNLEIAHLHPTAAALGRAWFDLDDDARRSLRTLPPQPAYLRPPHITVAKKGHPLLRGNPGA